MKAEKLYIKLGDLEVYKLSMSLSRGVWKMYRQLDWQEKKIMGDQFIQSTDSVGANIAEGYGRFHYKDRIKFYYNARGSLLESKHWLLLFYERRIINEKPFRELLALFNEAHKKLNLYIKACYPD